MDPERYQELMDRFDELCDRPHAEQVAAIHALAARDADLADRLAALLDVDARDTEVLDLGAGARALAMEIERQEDATEPSESQRAGQQIGDWWIRERLGSGGVGTVHRIEHVDSGRVAAIKFLKKTAVSQPSDVTRFQREFKAIARLDHPGCLKVFEQGEGPLGHHFVMEFAAGGDLRRYTGAPASELIPLLAEVADTLRYVHAQGVVHRDLKPANVLLTDDQPVRTKLADFGLVKVPDATAIITGTGAVMGSIDFMSPEQINGQPADRRSDLYGFGCMAFVLVTGQAPFAGDNFERLYARLKGEPPSLAERAPDAPMALSALCQRLMARDPDDRPQSFDEVVPILQTLI
jgi:eukaryotic-like serine/threonine-protein kinase